LAAGSTVTPVIDLAKAFSHKPHRLEFEIHETDGEKRMEVTGHTGERHGYLYRVLVAEPGVDMVQHPTSVFPAEIEMLTTRDLPLQFLEELPI